MKRQSRWLVFGLAFFVVLGCARKEITPLQRKQAANLVSEAEFAATMRDYSRAEGLLAQATALAPDSGVYWLSLGSTRMRLGQKGGARDAYKHALAAFQDATAKDKSDADAALQQVYVLALLGRVDDARRLQEKLPSQYPNERSVRSFVEEKRLDRILADPHFKELAL